MGLIIHVILRQAKTQQHWSYLQISCDTVHDAAARQATVGSAHGSTCVASMILCQWHIYVLAIGIDTCMPQMLSALSDMHMHSMVTLTRMQISTCGEKRAIQLWAWLSYPIWYSKWFSTSFKGADFRSAGNTDFTVNCAARFLMCHATLSLQA